MSKPSIAVITTVPYAVDVFFRGHLKRMIECYSVVVVTSRDGIEVLDDLPHEVEVVGLPLTRQIDPLCDLGNLLALARLLRDRRIDLVHSVTPKAGLIGMLAGFLAGTPHRLHTFTGQVWVTRRGVGRWMLKFIDRIIAWTASAILIDSPSQRQFLIDEGVVPSTKSAVLEKGSISGIDPLRFKPDRVLRDAMRKQLGLSDSDVAILFLGRITIDKGALDLAEAFVRMQEHAPRAVLLVVGPDEQGTSSKMQSILAGSTGVVRFVPYTNDPESFMRAADIFCLPSYREGFGNTVIEAAGCELPAVASRIYGLIDAVADGETGVLVAPGDPAALSAELLRLVQDPKLRRLLGSRARKRAIRWFGSAEITDALMQYYARLLGKSDTTEVPGTD